MPSTLRFAAILAIAACAKSEPPIDDCATTGKCDLPDDPAEISCTKRRSDAYNENREAFTEGFLRWSCADVQGVTADDRGQEYCEYFAIAQLPETDAPAILGRNLGLDSSYGTTPGGVDLTPAQINALEADDTAIVGQCVFTTWNSDQPGPVAACDGQAQTTCPKVMGVPVDETNFRMAFEVNSTDAAQILVEDCLAYPTPGDEENPRDLRHDDFMRGCLWNAELNETEFRKSDTTICSSVTRLAECGCSANTETPLGELVAPWEMRGFQLGGWSGFVSGSEADSQLPPSCRYVDIGENGQTIVTCDLSAADLLYGAADVRAACADKYADMIVVHVPIPAVTCDPSTSGSPYADSCSATPWVLEPPAAGY